MRIGLDLDGCFANFNQSFMQTIASVTGRNLFPPGYEPTTWHYPQALGYTQAEIDRVWAVIHQNSSWWAKLQPYKETNEAFSFLRMEQRKDLSLDVYFVTAREGLNAKTQTENWLRSHGIPNPTVLLSPHKLDCVRALDLETYLDDHAENCARVASYPGCDTYLLVRPWNRFPIQFKAMAERTNALPHVTEVHSPLEMLTRVLTSALVHG